MKITPKELKQIIKEELEAVKEKVVKRGDKYAYVSKKGKTLGTHDTKAGAEKQATAIRISRNVGEGIEEGRYRQATTEPELYDALKDAIGNRSEYMVMGVLRGVLDDRKDRRQAELNEDGHTDVPSAVRKLKTSMEDAMQILSALEHMPDTELPSWWMSKITLAADYLNKSRDYLLVSEEVNEVYSDKQRRWACAQMRDDFKGERSLTKKQAKEMCTGPMLKAGDKK